MNVGLISKRYAKALLDFSVKNNAEEEVYQAMECLIESFSLYADFAPILENPTLSKMQKKELILIATKGKKIVVFEKIVDLILQNNREAFLQRIALTFCDLYRKEKGIFYGKLTTAVSVDETTTTLIQQLLDKDNVEKIELKTKVDEEILGGFILDIDGVRLDASVKSQFVQLKKNLKHN